MEEQPTRLHLLKYKEKPFEKEAVVLFQYIVLSEHFRVVYNFIQESIKKQTEILSRLLWFHRQYMVNRLTAACPLIGSLRGRDILLEMRVELSKLRNSNESLRSSLGHLRKTFLRFEQYYKSLDFSQENDFINGDAYHKPISFHLEMTRDFFDYFMAWQLRLEYLYHLIDPEEDSILQKYMECLPIPEDFKEYFRQNLMYCKCLQPKPLCQIYRDLADPHTRGKVIPLFT